MRQGFVLESTLMKLVYTCLFSIIFSSPALSALKTIKLERPSSISAFDEYAFSTNSKSLASADEWDLKSQKLYIEYIENFENKLTKKSNLVFNLDGKFVDQELLYFGDNNEELKSEFLYDVLSKTFLCGLEKFKLANKVFCDDKKIPDEGLYLVKSAVDPAVDEKLGIVLAYQEHRKAFLDLQKDYSGWEILDSSYDSVVLKSFTEKEDAKYEGQAFFSLTKQGFQNLDLPFKAQLFMGKNCRDLKYDADEMNGFESVEIYNMELDSYALCTENLAKSIDKGRLFVLKKDQVLKYDLVTKESKVYDMSSLFQREWDGNAFINSFKNFSDEILVASVIYSKKGSWLAEKFYMVKDDKQPSFVAMRHKPVHFFSKESFLACVEDDDEEKELPLALTLVDLKDKRETKVFDTDVKLYGAKAIEGLDLNLLNDRNYGCSDMASVISKFGDLVVIADKYYTEKAKYPLNENLKLNILLIKAIDFLKIDYKRFCGLSLYEKSPFRYPVMNKESNYDKFCNDKDGILIKSPNPVYDKPKDLFLSE